MVSAVEPSFEITEGTVDMKRMSLGLMQYMAVAGQGRLGIAFPSIRVNLTARLHMSRKKCANRNGIGPLRYRQPKPPGFLHATPLIVGIHNHFHRPKDQRGFFILGDATACFSPNRPPDNDLIGFHTPAQ